MSWTHDFGQFADAKEARAYEADVNIGDFVDHVSVNDHVEFVMSVVAALMESGAMGGHPVRVQASGSALPGHRPYGGVVRRFKVMKHGQEYDSEQVLEQPAVEGITITLTQVAPEGLEPEVVGDGAT